jgi:hypothetical protein
MRLMSLSSSLSDPALGSQIPELMNLNAIFYTGFA